MGKVRVNMNVDPIPEQESQHDSRRILHWPKWRTWKKIFLILAVILVSGDVYLHYWAKQWVEERLAENPGNPQEIAKVKEFWKKPIAVPKEWATIKPPSQAMIDAFKEANQVWEDFKSNESSVRFRISAVYKNQSMLSNETDRAQYLEDIAKMEPFLALAQKISQIMKNEAESAGSRRAFPTLPPNSGILYTLRELVDQKALALVAEDKYEEAFDSYQTVFPLMIVNPAYDFSEYWSKFQLLQNIIPEIEGNLSAIADTSRLRSFLNTLHWAEPFLCADIGDQIDTYQLLQDYRSFTGKPPAEFKSNLTAGDVIHNMADILMENYGAHYDLFAVSIYFFTNEKPQWEQWEFQLAGVVRPFIFTNTLNEFMMLRCFFPFSAQRIQNYESEGTLLFDALRLRVAARLYELETGKKVTATSDLVPNYIPKEIRLRKSGKSFEWDEEGRLIVPAFL